MSTQESALMENPKKDRVPQKTLMCHRGRKTLPQTKEPTTPPLSSLGRSRIKESFRTRKKSTSGCRFLQTGNFLITSSLARLCHPHWRVHCQEQPGG